jgi:hypothetical protein
MGTTAVRVRVDSFQSSSSRRDRDRKYSWSIPSVEENPDRLSSLDTTRSRSRSLAVPPTEGPREAADAMASKEGGLLRRGSRSGSVDRGGVVQVVCVARRTIIILMIFPSNETGFDAQFDASASASYIYSYILHRTRSQEQLNCREGSRPHSQESLRSASRCEETKIMMLRAAPIRLPLFHS